MFKSETRGGFVGGLFRLMALTLALLFCSAEARASTVAFDNFGPGDSFEGSGSTVSGDTQAALVFTSSASGIISLVEAAFFDTSSPIEVTLTLFSSAGTSPGLTLDSATAFTSTISDSILSFTGWTAALTSGVEYWLVATAPASAPWNLAPFSADGQRYFSGDGGSTWNAADFPTAARITVSSIPLPAALPLFISGLAALGFLSWRRRLTAP